MVWWQSPHAVTRFAVGSSASIVSRGSLMPTDVNGRPQCDLTIITDAKPEADGTWLGAITDPRDGDTYRAKLWVDDSGNLHLRGFLGISLFGSTQVWRPFTGHLGAECGLA